MKTPWYQATSCSIVVLCEEIHGLQGTLARALRVLCLVRMQLQNPVKEKIPGHFLRCFLLRTMHAGSDWYAESLKSKLLEGTNEVSVGHEASICSPMRVSLCKVYPRRSVRFRSLHHCKGQFFQHCPHLNTFHSKITHCRKDAAYFYNYKRVFRNL